MLRKLLVERARRRAVDKLRGINISAEPGFERFLEQAVSAFSAPIALMTMIEDDQVQILAARGMPTQCVSRRDAFCNYAVDRANMLEICDAASDAAYLHLPLVRADPHVRYYIGAPLRVANGPDVGTLCILDTVPRPPASADQRAYLTSLARQATALLERNARLKGRGAS